MHRVTIAGGHRVLAGVALGTLVNLCAPDLAGPAHAQAQSKPRRPATAAATAAPAADPEVVVAGVRIVGPGYGDNRSELRAFNETPGATISLAIKMPAGSAIVALDEGDCKLASITDDTGTDLIEQGRYGSFPKTSADGSTGIIEIESKMRPGPGANAILAEGTLTFMASPGTKPVKVAKVKFENGFAMKAGANTITLQQVSAADKKQSITLAMTRTMLQTIRDVRFLDAKGEVVESHRTSSGYSGDAAEISYDLNTEPAPAAALELNVWQNLKAADGALQGEGRSVAAVAGLP
jgi:hypothetical protein